MLRLTWPQVLAWRLRRQGLTDPLDEPADDVVRGLAGVQAQLASAAALAVALRQAAPQAGEVDRLLSERRLVRTWAARGTLHLLDVRDAPASLALLAAARSWERAGWQRTFLPVERLERLAGAVQELLDGAVLTREELAEGVVRLTGDDDLREQLRSGWSAVLKPLAWQGLLCQGPPDGARVTFTSPRTWVPGWPGLPTAEEAAGVVLPTWLGAHGPATPEAFDAWLLRGATRRAVLRGWFAGLGERLTQVEVEGERRWARTQDLDGLAAARPCDVVRLLPAFDQYLLGPGTSDPHLLDPARRGDVSRAAGWIAPVVVRGGRVVGTWSLDGARLRVALFPECGPVPRDALDREVARVAACTDRRPRLEVESHPAAPSGST